MWRIFAIVLLGALVTESITVAQDRSADAHVAKLMPGNCETNSADLDDLRNEALEGAGKDGVIIAIARLGNRETSRIQNRRRLLAVKNHLVKYGVPVQKIITAEGERVNGYGRVELYVAGKLRNILLAHPNKALCVECCNPKYSDFYPYRRGKR